MLSWELSYPTGLYKCPIGLYLRAAFNEGSTLVVTQVLGLGQKCGEKEKGNGIEKRNGGGRKKGSE